MKIRICKSQDLRLCQVSFTCWVVLVIRFYLMIPFKIWRWSQCSTFYIYRIGRVTVALCGPKKLYHFHWIISCFVTRILVLLPRTMHSLETSFCLPSFFPLLHKNFIINFYKPFLLDDTGNCSIFIYDIAVFL